MAGDLPRALADPLRSPVEATVPVHLVYFTAEVDPDGRLRVYDDVYRRDGRLADALGLERPTVRRACSRR